MKKRKKSSFERGAGVLMHVSSLPNAYGIGTFGKSAYDFADALASAKIKYWQVLPLVQTGFGDSPYQSVYASSGNPYFIDLEMLVEEGLLKKSELRLCAYTGEKINYDFLYRRKYALLRRAFFRFDTSDSDFLSFVGTGAFEDYALFMAIKMQSENRPFILWDGEYKYRNADRLARFKRENYGEYLFWQFLQYKFSAQWKALKSYVNGLGIKIIGDLPLYVSGDSADVWANPALFKLSADLKPAKVAGVPPDYFSATGQLWGNPVYRWEEHRKDGYRWWTERIKKAFEIYDIVRIDHFRGFDRYFEIDAGEDTAVGGKWKNGPKEAFFRSVNAALGQPAFIAEDLGILDEGVLRLLKNTGYPGMKIMLFAFDGNENNAYLPKNITPESVCYTGTHDNDTVCGYIDGLSDRDFCIFRERVERAAEAQGVKVNTDTRAGTAKALCALVLESKASIAVLPVQDIMGAGNDDRMNTPSTSSGNWQFRLQKLPPKKVWNTLRAQVVKYGRD